MGEVGRSLAFGELTSIPPTSVRLSGLSKAEEDGWGWGGRWLVPGGVKPNAHLHQFLLGGAKLVHGLKEKFSLLLLVYEKLKRIWSLGLIS